MKWRRCRRIADVFEDDHAIPFVRRLLVRHTNIRGGQSETMKIPVFVVASGIQYQCYLLFSAAWMPRASTRKQTAEWKAIMITTPFLVKYKPPRAHRRRRARTPIMVRDA